MESVIWAFKQLWDKGLAYEGYRVLPYCWNDETPLSSHELRMDDDVYQSRQDPAITVGFTVTEGALDGCVPAGLDDDAVDAAVQPGGGGQSATSSTCSCSRRSGATCWRKARLAAYAGNSAKNPRSWPPTAGADLLGTRYLPPFPYFMDAPNSFQVLPGDFVTTEDGTGIVHMSPAYGEDDMATATGRRHRRRHAGGRQGPVRRDRARLRRPARLRRQPADHPRPEEPERARRRRTAPVLLRHETYEHSYPHCWRCRNPLIYRAVSSWFVKVTEFRDRMVELNQQITWYPEHVKDGQFGKWLQGARDWSISRNRYWGTPDSGVDVRRPGLSAHRRLRQPRRTRARLRRAAGPTCTGPTSTS